MLVTYSKPCGRPGFQIAVMSLTYCNQQKRAEWAGSFAAGDYTSVWLVPGLEEAPEAVGLFVDSIRGRAAEG